MKYTHDEYKTIYRKGKAIPILINHYEQELKLGINTLPKNSNFIRNLIETFKEKHD